MQNTLHDELLADYFGIATVTGVFKAAWFLRFMGLEDFPSYRDGGRLTNYRGSPPLSGAAFRVLQSMVVEAAENLERFDRVRYDGERSLEEKAVMLATLAQVSVEALASSNAVERLSLASEKAERLV